MNVLLLVCFAPRMQLILAVLDTISCSLDPFYALNTMDKCQPLTRKMHRVFSEPLKVCWCFTFLPFFESLSIWTLNFCEFCYNSCLLLP